jgi:anti-sigma B factor antagonist
MSSTPAKICVLVGEQFACIKLTGRANFSSSIDFKTFVNELSSQGCSHFLLDLSECLLMDSTFLGVLAGLGLKLSQGQKGRTAEPRMELFNPSARITELLENLGVLHLFKLTQGPLALPGQMETLPQTPSSPSKEEITRACLEAHQTLMEINPGNVAKFKDVAQFLAEDLKKLKAGP